MADESPKYAHDCGRCTFLGRHAEGGVDYDLYHCLDADRHPLVLARFGDGPGDCDSRMTFTHCGHLPRLVEAKRRAAATGLLVIPVPLYPEGEGAEGRQESWRDRSGLL